MILYSSEHTFLQLFRTFVLFSSRACKVGRAPAMSAASLLFSFSTTRSLHLPPTRPARRPLSRLPRPRALSAHGGRRGSGSWKKKREGMPQTWRAHGRPCMHGSKRGQKYGIAAKTYVLNYIESYHLSPRSNPGGREDNTKNTLRTGPRTHSLVHAAWIRRPLNFRFEDRNLRLNTLLGFEYT